MSSFSRKLSRLAGVGFGGKTPEPPDDDAAPAEAGSCEAPGPSEDPARIPGTGADVGDDEGRWDAFRAALRDKDERPKKPATSAPMVLPGTTEQTPHGPLHRILRALHEDHCHGDAPVAAIHALDPAWVARFGLDDGLAGVDLSRLVFLDTETTGLAGGTGTLPFLVGLAWFEGRRLHVEQLFLRRMGEEVPLLRRVAEHIDNASCLVTYNGKSFDWPLLRTRFVMNRLVVPPVPAHLDLVHATRRLLKIRMPSVRLVEVERAVLGHVREGDVDGARIPEIYLEYHRTGAHPELPLVLSHNELDVIAMPAILGRLAARFGDGDATADAIDHLACALVAERAGDDGLADRFASRVAGELGGEHAVKAHLLRARIARRREAPKDEEAALQSALDATHDAFVAAEVHLALAKLYEHRLRDPDQALVHARHTGLAEGEAASLRRGARLRLKKRPSLLDET